MAFCNHLPFASSVALRISGKDAEVVPHPPATSMVPLGTFVGVEGSGGLGTPKPSPSPMLHRVLPHCSFQTLRRCLTDPDELLFHSIQKKRYKMDVSFFIFFFLERIVFQFLFFTVALFLQHY